MKLFLPVFFLGIALCASAQQGYSSRNIFARFENDVAEGTDEYYTSGGSIGIFHPVLKKNPLNKFLFIVPRATENCYGIEWIQSIYTPRNTDTIHYLPDDRPFAGSFMMYMRRVSFRPEKSLRLLTSLGLGVVGGAALAGQTQNGIHAMINSAIYKGWYNQLGNRLLINYDMTLEKSFYTKKYTQFIGKASTELGNLRTNAAVGYVWRIGKLSPYFYCWQYRKGDEKWYASVYLEASYRLVIYDATLNGAYQDAGQPIYSIRRFVFRTAVGINIIYKGLTVTVSHHFLTPEFSSGGSHAYDSASISFSF